MTPLIYILITAVGYGLIRAKHDSFISHGKWKPWAFTEGAFIAVCFVAVILHGFGIKWWYGPVMGLIFAFTFWLIFDCVTGLYRGGSIMYIGEHGWDERIRKAFMYNKPIGRWEATGAVRLVLFKIFWLFILIAVYRSLLYTYH